MKMTKPHAYFYACSDWFMKVAIVTILTILYLLVNEIVSKQF